MPAPRRTLTRAAALGTLTALVTLTAGTASAASAPAGTASHATRTAGRPAASCRSARSKRLGKARGQIGVARCFHRVTQQTRVSPLCSSGGAKAHPRQTALVLGAGGWRAPAGAPPQRSTAPDHPLTGKGLAPGSRSSRDPSARRRSGFRTRTSSRLSPARQFFPAAVASFTCGVAAG